MTAKYQCASFAGGMCLDDYHAELARDVESRIGLYATDDDGTSEPYVGSAHSEIVVEYHDERGEGYIPWQMWGQSEVPWLHSYLIRTWYATLMRGERISGRVFRATYKIEVDK